MIQGKKPRGDGGRRVRAGALQRRRGLHDLRREHYPYCNSPSLRPVHGGDGNRPARSSCFARKPLTCLPSARRMAASEILSSRRPSPTVPRRARDPPAADADGNDFHRLHRPGGMRRHLRRHSNRVGTSGRRLDHPLPCQRRSLADPAEQRPSASRHDQGVLQRRAQLLHRRHYAEPRRRSAALLFGGVAAPPQRTGTAHRRHRWQSADRRERRAEAGERHARLGQRFCGSQSGCGSGAQVIASGSGEAASDSLRAYELPAQEAIPASAPLAMEGTRHGAVARARRQEPAGRGATTIAATMRWTVLRRSAISFLLVLVAVLGGARTRPHYGGTLRVEIEGDPWQQPNGIARRLVFDGLTRMDASRHRGARAGTRLEVGQRPSPLAIPSAPRRAFQ